MRHYRPLLIQDLQLEMPGVRMHRLQLNRHLSETQGEFHSHSYHQVLIYLSGSGRQCVDGNWYEVRPGTAFWIEPGISHRFEKNQRRNPLCFVLDFTLTELHVTARNQPYYLNQSDFNEIKSRLSSLLQKYHPEFPSSPWLPLKAAAVMLEMIHFLVVLLESRDKPVRGRLEEQLTQLLLKHENSLLNLRQISELTGYQQDHLNRLLKAECGLTLGELRSKLRLQIAQEDMLAGLPIQKVAEKVGMLDANYFTRWFKQQTGYTPTTWRRIQV